MDGSCVAIVEVAQKDTNYIERCPKQRTQYDIVIRFGRQVKILKAI